MPIRSTCRSHGISIRRCVRLESNAGTVRSFSSCRHRRLFHSIHNYLTVEFDGAKFQAAIGDTAPSASLCADFTDLTLSYVGTSTLHFTFTGGNCVDTCDFTGATLTVNSVTRAWVVANVLPWNETIDTPVYWHEFRFSPVNDAGYALGPGTCPVYRFSLPICSSPPVDPPTSGAYSCWFNALGAGVINPWYDRKKQRRVGKECRSRWSPY